MRSRVNSTTTAPCGSCQKDVKSKGILCSRCSNWHHETCVGLSNDMYKLLGDIRGCLWICDTCLPIAEHLVKQQSPDRDFIHRTINEAIAPLQSSIQCLTTSENPSENIVKSAVKETLDSIRIPAATQVTKEHSFELRINGIPETDGSNSAKQSNDEQQLITILKHLGEPGDENVVSARRMGRPQSTDTTPKRARTLLVRFRSEWTIRKLLNRSSDLKSFAFPVYISRMLSPADHVIESKLLAKRRELINNDVLPGNLKIRNLKLYNDGVEVKI